MDKNKKTLAIAVGNPQTFNGFFQGQLEFLSNYFNIIGIASDGDFSCYNFTVYRLDIERKISLLKDLKSLFEAIKLLRKIKPDAINGNTPKVALITMIASFIAGIKIRIYTCHGLRYESKKGIYRIFLKTMEKITCLMSTHVICVSPSLKKILNEEKLCDNEKSHVLNHGSVNGIDEQLLNYSLSTIEIEKTKKECNIRDNAIIFCYIGRLVKDKGINELVSAFNSINTEKAHLLLVGPLEDDIDPLLPQTIESIHNNKRIHSLGWKDNVYPYIYISDVLILPSYREGLGNVLLEAGALKKPCIITNCTGCKDIIFNEINGKIIVKPTGHNYNEVVYDLIKKMREFLMSSDYYRNKLGSNGFNLVKKNFSRKDVWEATLHFYKKIL